MQAVCRRGGNGGTWAGDSSATVRRTENQIREVILDIAREFCASPLPPCRQWTEPSRWGCAFLSEEAGGWFSACTAVLLTRLKAKPKNRVKKCPRRCERENSRAGDTQAWLCDGLKQSCYVQSYSQTLILISADHISNVDYNSPIVWIKYLKTTYTLLFILKWLQKRAKFLLLAWLHAFSLLNEAM